MIRYIRRPYHIPDVRIETLCGDLADDLALLYGDFFTDCERNVPNLNITVTKSKEDGHEICCNGVVNQSADPLQDLENLIYDHTFIQSGMFGMHAGAVEIGGKGMIFAAPTSNGKTTLTAYISQFGHHYITDDCVLINMDQMMIHPFPKPIHLREGGMNVLSKIGIDLSTIRLDRGRVKRFVYTPPFVQMDCVPIGQILFLHRNRSINEVKRLHPAHAMQNILKSPIKPQIMDKRYICFVRRLAQIPCVIMCYKDMGFVLDYLKRC